MDPWPAAASEAACTLSQNLTTGVKTNQKWTQVTNGFGGDESELAAELAEAKARKELLFPWPGSAGGSLISWL